MRFLLLIVFSAISSSVVAGPDVTANRFLEDSPSMMDFGAYRLEMELHSQGFEDVYVSYDWDRNRIVIGRVILEEDSAVDNSKEECKEWVRSIRKAAYVDPETGQTLGKISSFARSFSHIGFARTINSVTQDEALEQLDRIFLVRSETGSLSSFSPLFACEGMLLGSTISIEE